MPHPKQHNELGMWPHRLDPRRSHSVVHVVRGRIEQCKVDGMRVLVQGWQLPRLLRETCQILSLGILGQRPSIEEVHLLCPRISTLPALFHDTSSLTVDSNWRHETSQAGWNCCRTHSTVRNKIDAALVAVRTLQDHACRMLPLQVHICDVKMSVPFLAIS